MSKILFEFPEDYKSKRGIPKAKFIEDIGKELLKENYDKVDPLLQEQQMFLSKYQMMENQLQSQKDRLLSKIPEIEKTQEAILLLQKKKETEDELSTYFKLSDNVFVNAEIQNSGTVLLWLGVGVLVEYTHEEALKVLSKSLEESKVQLDLLNEELSYLKEQHITTEVNISRCHNFGVLMRKKSGQ